VPAQRALGIQWSMETDTFSFNISIKPCQPNRRGISSLVSSTFNPLGFAVPFVLVATEMLQDLCAPNKDGTTKFHLNTFQAGISGLKINNYHKLSAHSGRQHILSMICQKYWIIKANTVMRRVLWGCYGCNKQEAPPCEQKKKADLPEDCLIPNKPPSTAVGVDLALLKDMASSLRV